MLPRAVIFVFLAIALSSSTVEAIPGQPPNQKGSSSLSRATTSSQPASTSKGANNNGKGQGNPGNGGNKTSSCTPNGGDPQTSCTLDPKVIATGFEQNGQETPAAGQVASLISNNNFINFCLTVNKPITNGQQIKGGSCNPAPMGVIASSSNMPSSKFVSPANLDTVKANTNFTVTMALNNLEAGNFVNAEQNYYSAPQQVNAQGSIIGHSHFVIQAIDSLTSTKVLDPATFAFFKGIDTAAGADGTVSVPVPSGLPAGTYRLASINTAANHQPCLVAVAQHGSLDDQVYFTVTNDGKAAAGSGQNNNNPASNPSSSQATPTTPPANGQGKKGNGNKSAANPGTTTTTDNNHNPNSGSPAPSSSTPQSGAKTGKGNGNNPGNPSSSSSAPGRATGRSFQVRRDIN